MGRFAKGCALQPNRAARCGRSADYQTAQVDIFTGGDAHTGPRFAIDALQRKAGAISIHRFVHAGLSLTIGRTLRNYQSLISDLNLLG
jgi:hypothetical protein